MYNPPNIFANSELYYCTSSNSPNQYIHFDFEKEYNFYYFKIIYPEKETKCRLKQYLVELYDDEHRKTNEILYNIEDKDKSSDIQIIGDKARYIYFIFKENFNGNYFIIKNLEFYTIDDIC